MLIRFDNSHATTKMMDDMSRDIARMSEDFDRIAVNLGIKRPIDMKASLCRAADREVLKTKDRGYWHLHDPKSAIAAEVKDAMAEDVLIEFTPLLIFVQSARWVTARIMDIVEPVRADLKARIARRNANA